MSEYSGKGENAPFAFAKDKVAFSRAVEELRAEKADLNDPAVIEKRYNEILKGSKKGAKKSEETEDAPEEPETETETPAEEEEAEVEEEVEEEAPKPAKAAKGAKGKGKKK